MATSTEEEREMRFWEYRSTGNGRRKWQRTKLESSNTLGAISDKTSGIDQPLTRIFREKKNSDQDNDMLISSFTEEEIKEAVWLCGSSKSPMPDEFNFRFFKKFWHAIRADLLKMMEEFHINEKLSEGLIRLLLCYYRKKRWQQIEILHAYFLDWRNLPDNIQNIGEQIK